MENIQKERNYLDLMYEQLLPILKDSAPWKWTEIEVTKSCLTLCNPMDCSPPGSFIQARVLEWVAISFFRGLPDPGMEPGSPALQADALLPEPPGKRFKLGLLWQSWNDCSGAARPYQVTSSQVAQSSDLHQVANKIV